jgi:tetratricopeptide (TPR) repeat protein
MHGRALEIVERGIIADGSLAASAGAVEGFVYHKRKEWQEAEAAYRRATTADVVDSNAFNWYSLMLSGVGRLEDSLEQVLIAQKIDPSSTVINARLGMVYTWLGDSEKAAEFFDRASLLDASEEIHMLGKTLLYTRQGRLDEAASAFGTGVSMAGRDTQWIAPVFAALEDPANTAAALSAIESAFSDPQMDPRFNIIVRSVLGDTDGAMQVAHALADSGAFFEMDFMFMPELRAFREHGDFLSLMEKFGIRRYWDANNCTWQDDKLSC